MGVRARSEVIRNKKKTVHNTIYQQHEHRERDKEKTKETYKTGMEFEETNTETHKLFHPE